MVIFDAARPLESPNEFCNVGRATHLRIHFVYRIMRLLSDCIGVTFINRRRPAR